MTPSPKPSRVVAVVLPLLVCAFLLAGTPALAQSVSVTSANPSSAAQGAVNLNVTVNGKGFKNGAAAKWFVTGTTNPGGVTVNSTAFVSETQLTANITVSGTATVSGYDIAVTNRNGGSGKGTDLFSVLQATDPNTCTTQPLPTGISWVNSLNYATSSGAAAYGPDLGITVQARQMVLGGASVLVVAVGTPSTTGKLEIFFLNPSTGQILDGTAIGANTAVQPHITVTYGAGTSALAVGDVNGDGVPDFVAGSRTTNAANAVVGSLNSNGVLTYQFYPLTIPAGATGAGWGVAMGDLNGTGKDVIAVGAIGGGTGRSAALGEVLLYSWNGSSFTNYLNIPSPLPNPKRDESFGRGVAIADVTGSTAKDLIVGAPGSIVNGNADAGRVFVFPGPVSATDYLTLTTGIQSDSLGLQVATGDIDGDLSTDGYVDLLAAASGRALGYYGAVSTGASSNFVVQPSGVLSKGWATSQPDVSDVNGDGLADVLIGAPNANSGAVCGGVAYLWLSSTSAPLATQMMLSSPVSNGSLFGWAAAFGPGTRFFFVTDHGIEVGTTSGAGQVYVYKVN